MTTAAKPTPGPWRWELNRKHKHIHLCGGNPKEGFGRYDLDILQPRRWGMNGATVAFRNARCIMETAEEFGIDSPGREHHSDWFQALNHPDADLIAAAPDHALLLAAIASSLARIEPLGRDVEICTGGLRYATKLDENGCPVMTDAARAALKATR